MIVPTPPAAAPAPVPAVPGIVRRYLPVARLLLDLNPAIHCGELQLANRLRVLVKRLVVIGKVTR